VNKYRLDKQEEVEVLEIDNSKVREQQIARINNIRRTRDESKVCIKQQCSDHGTPFYCMAHWTVYIPRTLTCHKERYFVLIYKI